MGQELTDLLLDAFSRNFNHVLVMVLLLAFCFLYI